MFEFHCIKVTSTQSVTALLNELKWPDLSSLRKCGRLTMMYKILNGLIDIPHEDYVRYSTTNTQKS